MSFNNRIAAKSVLGDLLLSNLTMKMTTYGCCEVVFIVRN